MGLPLGFPTLPSKWCFRISPVPGLAGQEKHLQVERDRTARHLHPLAAQAKCQGVGIPRAAGCLDFSQGIFGKCQNRNLLTKTCNVSIQARPHDQVQTLLFSAVLGSTSGFSGQNVWSFRNVKTGNFKKAFKKKPSKPKHLEEPAFPPINFSMGRFQIHVFPYVFRTHFQSVGFPPGKGHPGSRPSIWGVWDAQDKGCQDAVPQTVWITPKALSSQHSDPQSRAPVGKNTPNPPLFLNYPCTS